MYGCRPEERPINQYLELGVINVNKPSGPTSHQVSDTVKKIFNFKRAGHSGTLDPKVTGVLPIALEGATRIMQFLLPEGKEYVCLMHLHDNVDEDKIMKVFKKLSGKINQLPPIKSAVKRQWRKRTIYYVEILEIDQRDVLFKIGCEAGTYIRKYVHDFGQEIGTGAHMVELVRTKVGMFNIHNWHNLHEIKDAYVKWKDKGDEKDLRNIVVPIEKAISHLSKVWVSDNCVDALAHGADLSLPGVVKLESDINENDNVAVFTLKDELIMVGKAMMDSKNMMELKKGLAVKIGKVFIQRGIYPKFVKKN